MSESTLERSIERLRRNDPTLTFLDFQVDDIGPDGARALAEVLENNSTLTFLSLEGDDIGPDGARALAGALENNSTLKELWLSFNNIGPDGARTLAGALEKNSTLKELRLSTNNIGDEGARALAGALEKNSTLKKLWLSRINIGNEGARALAGALENNSTLTFLELDFNNIGTEGAGALAGALEKNSTLTSLSLYNNNIGAKGAWTFAGALEKNSTLTSLRLDGNSIGNEGARALAGALEKNSTLTSLSLYSNNIGAEGARALAVALEKNSTLTALGLICNKIGNEGARALADALEKNTTLKYLNLWPNGIVAMDVVELIKKNLKRNETKGEEWRAVVNARKVREDEEFSATLLLNNFQQQRYQVQVQPQASEINQGGNNQIQRDIQNQQVLQQHQQIEAQQNSANMNGMPQASTPVNVGGMSDISNSRNSSGFQQHQASNNSSLNFASSLGTSGLMVGSSQTALHQQAQTQALAHHQQQQRQRLPQMTNNNGLEEVHQMASDIKETLMVKNLLDQITPMQSLHQLQQKQVKKLWAARELAYIDQNQQQNHQQQIPQIHHDRQFLDFSNNFSQPQQQQYEGAMMGNDENSFQPQLNQQHQIPQNHSHHRQQLQSKTGDRNSVAESQQQPQYLSPEMNMGDNTNAFQPQKDHPQQVPQNHQHQNFSIDPTNFAQQKQQRYQGAMRTRYPTQHDLHEKRQKHHHQQFSNENGKLNNPTSFTQPQQQQHPGAMLKSKTISSQNKRRVHPFRSFRKEKKNKKTSQKDKMQMCIEYLENTEEYCRQWSTPTKGRSPFSTCNCIAWLSDPEKLDEREAVANYMMNFFEKDKNKRIYWSANGSEIPGIPTVQEDSSFR